MPNVAAICGLLERYAPTSLAAEWDNVGLLLGDTLTEVRHIITCLTVTPEVVREAIESGVQLIVTHHPILFRGTKRLSTQTPEGRLLWPLATAGVAVYSPHTSFDNTAGGINDFLSQQYGLVEVTALKRREGAKHYKIVVFTPETDLRKVADAMFEAGAGRIGQYSRCSFRTSGTGTFLGSESSNPTVGKKGVYEEAAEQRLEVLCPENVLDSVISAMRRAHSYEEPAFDVYPLKAPLTTAGEGRIGKLPEPVSLDDLARRSKSIFRVPVLQYQGEPSRKVQRIAIVCGAGGEFLSLAQRAKADVFVTGELRFHECIGASAQQLALILPGHYASERLAVEALALLLQEQFPDVRVRASTREQDLSRWV